MNLTETSWKTNKIQLVCLVIVILNNGPAKNSLKHIPYHMSRVVFYDKDQSEARKTGPGWPILPCKDLFLGNTTSGSDIALLKEGNITSGGDIALFFFFFKKESRHSRQGNVHVLGLLLPKKCRRR